MALYVRMISDEWNEHPACLEDNPEAWLAANPPTVTFGPFDRVEFRDKGAEVVGHLQGLTPLLIADRRYDSGWILRAHAPQEYPRHYDGCEIVSEG